MMIKEYIYLNRIKNAGKLENLNITLREGSLEELLTPPAVKDPITNESFETDGIEVLTSPVRLKERNLTLFFYVRGKNAGEYYKNYLSFISWLRTGVTDAAGNPTGITELTVRLNEIDETEPLSRDLKDEEPDPLEQGTNFFSHTFRLIYKNCQKYASYGNQGGLFEIQFLEPRPTQIRPLENEPEPKITPA